MNQSGFVKLAVIGFGFVIASFFVRGFGQLVIGRPTAELFQAPILLVGFGILVCLFVRATLDAVGIWEVERTDA
ncbi:hypothetical protein D8Y22_11185 [Salinadaptatus halalkaliphilus]|uniref:Uncharacterized protein n=1 Tax=Salinadaptatus halalkaliphilus TaxID=2419781 RepID=A0A4S3TNK7_9EURY|nr:hypothetical protein [Salinadaptatus halalkaliphilus]THE64813.1 hypothetical protein D8Y22_11185 [Salinadaptatus halalkaliphilus]